MQPHRSTRLQGTDVVLAIENPKAALRAPMHKPIFYNAVEEKHSNIPQLSWEAALNQYEVPEPGTVPQVRGKDGTKNPCRNIEDHPEE